MRLAHDRPRPTHDPNDSQTPEAGALRDELLLRAVLSDRRLAQEAWQALRPAFDLERLASGWSPVMPLLYARLRDVAPGAPLLQRLKGLVRFTRSRNQALLGHLVPVLDTLERAGIAAAAMQAVPLALQSRSGETGGIADAVTLAAGPRRIERSHGGALIDGYRRAGPRFRQAVLRHQGREVPPRRHRS